MYLFLPSRINSFFSIALQLQFLSLSLSLIGIDSVCQKNRKIKKYRHCTYVTLLYYPTSHKAGFRVPTYT